MIQNNDIILLLRLHAYLILNEALNSDYQTNLLLEKYDIKDLLDVAMRQTSATSKVVYKQIKVFIVYIIKSLLESKEYDKALKIIEEYKKRVLLYIDKHKKITPLKMFKMLIVVLAMYGSMSLVKDCSSYVLQLKQNVETVEQETNNVIDTALVKNDIQELSSKKLKIVSMDDLNKETPIEVYNKHKDNYEFKSSKKSHDFIKSHENLLLYPYFANSKEEKEGKVTIGYGHVILKSDGTLYDKVQQLKKKGLIKLSFIRSNGRLILNPNHCKEIISKAEAEKLFMKDIKIAEGRAYKSILNMPIDDNIKAYLLYNQSIRDGLTSLCYNAGYLKSEKYSFIKKGLAKCRFDFDKNMINNNDYNVAFSLFKNIKDNNKRRTTEYNLFFANANKPINFSEI